MALSSVLSGLTATSRYMNTEILRFRQAVKALRLRGDNLFYVGFGALALLLASLPYLYGWLNPLYERVYTGLTYNIDDASVYLSWLRQAADGHFFQRNLFNVGEQRGAVVNSFALPLGWTARLTTLSLPAIYHLARVGFGAALLWAIARLICETISDERARRLAFALVCVGSGLGWIFGGYDSAKGDNQAIDLYQPEAITFLSLYYTPLFLAALALMVVFLTAVLRVERTGKVADIWPAAIAGAFLGNFHTYDVITLFSVYGAFRIAADVKAKRINVAAWTAFVVALIPAALTTGYTYYALIQDPLFKLRDVKTQTPLPNYLALGFGLPLMYALASAAPAARNLLADRPARLLLTIWAALGLILPYLPFDFQRKLIMGVHIPICLLAGCAVAAFSARLSGDFPKIAALFAVLLTVPSNALFLWRDMGRLDDNIGSTEHRPFLSVGETRALEWLRDKTKRSDGIFVSPDPTSHKRFPFFPLRPYLGVFIPAWTGNPVYIGHGSETASYGRKLTETAIFFRADAGDNSSESYRRDFLKANPDIRYILYNNALASGPPTDAQGNPLSDAQGSYTPVHWTKDDFPPYLTPVYHGDEHLQVITIFRVENDRL